jgi:hypothetical protein
MSRDILFDNFMNEALGAEMNSHVRRSEQARKESADFAADLKRVADEARRRSDRILNGQEKA